MTDVTSPAAEPQPNIAPAVDAQPNVVPPEQVTGKNSDPKPGNSDYEPRSFGAGVLKAKSESAAEIQKANAEVAAAKAELEAHLNKGKSTEELQTAVGIANSERDEALNQVKGYLDRDKASIQSRVDALPENVRKIVMRKVDAGNIAEAMADLLDLEASSTQQTLAPTTNAVPLDSSMIALEEYDQLLAAGDVKGLAKFRESKGNGNVQAALSERHKSRFRSS